MVDRIRAFRLLTRVSDNVALLELQSKADPRERMALTWLPGVKYLLQTATEACIDVAQHICASSSWGIPHDNGEAMTFLHRHGVIDAPIELAMRKAIGLRNVLVHEYIGVDDAIVLNRVADLSDLHQYVRQVTDWLQAEAQNPS
jgi:uncharacterized protein YutE (UPF0331/DUF86 family)